MRIVVVALLLTTLLAGCSDGSKDGPGFEVPAKDADGRYVIRLTAEHTFEPSKAEVPIDARVVFKAELNGCDVQSQQAGGPNSRQSQYGNGLIPEGADYAWWAPSEPAEFELVCTLHEETGMTGVLRIE